MKNYSKMVTVFTKFPIKEEFKEEYAKHLKEAVVQHETDKQPGFIEMKLLAPQSMPHMGENNMFIIETLWEDMKSFIAYTQSEAFKKSHENMPLQKTHQMGHLSRFYPATPVA